MQNVLSHWNEMVSDGVYRVPYGVDAPLSLVDLEDVAEVAAKVLTSSGHQGAIYELAGPEALSPAEIARVLSECLQRPVDAESFPVSEWVEQARADGLGDYPIEALTKMFRYYDQFGLRGNPQVLEWLLGRRPVTLGEAVERHAQEF
jgi:nucleoside-diphosphate-sugar epimerase